MNSETDRASIALDDVAVHLHGQDDVAVAKTDLQVGLCLTAGTRDSFPNRLSVYQPIPSGHKLALREIPAGQLVRRYGQVIGISSQQILPGEHVHTHNVSTEGFDREYAFGVDAEPVEFVPETDRRTFQGYRRADGRVGTRNYIAVISTVNCSAHTSRQIAWRFTPERLAAYPNVDGVIVLTHGSGCSMRPGSRDYVTLQRTLVGIAQHPNIGAAIIVGLGCEVNQVSDLVRNYDLRGLNGDPPPCLVIQELGGIRKTVNAGIEAIERLLPDVNAAQRTPQPISELVLALQCGGSDGWSGVTANPMVGLVSDEMVQQGGTVVLAETPEVYGAEQLLTRRAISPEVGRKLLEKVRWWESRARELGNELNDNLTPGNSAGGLTTIYEKALGAIAKGGHSPLTGVYDYAEIVAARGFTFMDSPGNDWVAVTGQVAGGSNLVLFTTGRGSVFGFGPAPTIKIASNVPTFERMQDDMDVNAGRVLKGARLEDVATELLDLVVAVASGQPSKSEAQGVGEAEFCPWFLGEML